MSGCKKANFGARTNHYYHDDERIKNILSKGDIELQSDLLQNQLFPSLNQDEIKVFKTNYQIRRNVAKIVARMMLLYGFIFVPGGIQQVKPLARKENGWQVGLYYPKNYENISIMMKFLNKIDMKITSGLVMLALCFAMHNDSVLRAKIKQSGIVKDWFQIQEYLNPYQEKFDIDVMRTKDTGCRFTGLKYTGNSCYQDSTLLALLAIPNDFVTANILEKNVKSISRLSNREIVCDNNTELDYRRRQAIQNELVRITKSMRGEISSSDRVQYCSNLRALLKGCPSASRQEFYGTGTQDAGEFLQYILALFQVNGLERIRSTDLTNDLSPIPKKTLTSRMIKEEVSPVVLIPAEALVSVPIKYYLTQTEDAVLDAANLVKGPDHQRYKRRIEQTVITKGDYLVFYVQRLSLHGERPVRLYTKINPSETIELARSSRSLSLFAIVVHKNVHYTCYIKCDDIWYYYNDLTAEIVSVGSFNDMLQSTPNPEKEGVLYFYSRI